MASPAVIQRAFEDLHAGRSAQAIAALRLLVQRDARDVAAVHALGLALVESGQHAQGIHHLERSVRAVPDSPAYRSNLGSALMQVRRFREARAHFEEAVRLDPKYPLSYMGLTIACNQLDDIAAGIAAARAGLAAKPGWPELTRNLGGLLEATGRLSEAIELIRALADDHVDDAGIRTTLLMLTNYAELPAAEVATEHLKYRGCVQPLRMPAPHDPNPERPLHVGLLSADLRAHPVARFVVALFDAKPSDWTLSVYSLLDAGADDAGARHFRAHADAWAEVGMMNDAAISTRIAADGVDVLIELGGHTAGGRMAVFDRPPAAVTISAIGYPNTTGHPGVAIRVVDSITDPIGSDGACSEQLVRIDPCFLCYTPHAEMPSPARVPSGPITFGSFNLASKISDSCMALWGRVLNAVPNARLLVKSRFLSDQSVVSPLRERFVRHGVPLDRLEIVTHLPTQQEHLALYGRVHVALDTMPYNGTTTTCEALWMGVPVVTRVGDRHAARVGASLLSAVGHAEWAAEGDDAFVAIAAGLAQDSALLAHRRTSLRSEMAASALCDGTAYSARWQKLVREAWRMACKAVRGASA
ncbi:MAG: tetratricopeptide repeat protein [Phycisphaerae bacterium]|nr:tetratricopeptide repeat protein [Phycisphaerae bacterium]